ncbi:hypothetical protein LCGC14_2720350 [marine sediment metagenome]|uniref:Uncharacterized protein n=1 Tax=marine sediment metagenome TaxID=412755 RepID=A0A0F8ZAC2_9ZZZZ
MDKLKIRFYINDEEEIIETEVDEKWTWGDIDRMFEDWIWDGNDTGYEILEMNGKPYKEDEIYTDGKIKD